MEDFLPKISENYEALKVFHEAVHSFNAGGRPIVLVSTEDIKDEQFRIDFFCKESIFQESEEWADFFYLNEVADFKKYSPELIEALNVHSRGEGGSGGGPIL